MRFPCRSPSIAFRQGGVRTKHGGRGPSNLPLWCVGRCTDLPDHLGISARLAGKCQNPWRCARRTPVGTPGEHRLVPSTAHGNLVVSGRRGAGEVDMRSSAGPDSRWLGAAPALDSEGPPRARSKLGEGWACGPALAGHWVPVAPLRCASANAKHRIEIRSPHAVEISAGLLPRPGRTPLQILPLRPGSCTPAGGTR